MSHVIRKPVYAICEQQRRRSACASAQSDQRLCCSLPRQYKTSSFNIRNFKPPPSFYGCAGQFVSYVVANPEDRFSRDEAQIHYSHTSRATVYIFGMLRLVKWQPTIGMFMTKYQPNQTYLKEIMGSQVGVLPPFAIYSAADVLKEVPWRSYHSCVLGQIALGKQCKSRADCSFWSGLIRVCIETATDVHTVISPASSGHFTLWKSTLFKFQENYRTISGVPMFTIFKIFVHYPGCGKW